MNSKIRICYKKDFPKNGRLIHKVNDLVILILKKRSKFFAFENKCPHVGAPMTNSILTPNSVICDWHGWEFSLPNGECLNLEEEPCSLNIFPVYLNEKDELILEIEKVK